MTMSGLFGGGQTGTTIFSVIFQVDQSNRVWIESNPGIYKFTARLKGKTLLAQGEVSFSTLVSGDRSDV